MERKLIRKLYESLPSWKKNTTLFPLCIPAQYPKNTENSKHTGITHTILISNVKVMSLFLFLNLFFVLGQDTENHSDK